MGNFDDLLKLLFGNDARKTLAAPVITCSENVVTMTGMGTIYYTTNGNTPTTSSTIYTRPITITQDTTFNAYCVMSGMNDSPVTTYTAIYVDLEANLPFYIQNESSSSGTVNFVQNNSSATAITLYTSTDNDTWTLLGTTSYPVGLTATLPANGRLYVKSNTGSAWCWKDDNASSPTYSGNYISVNRNFTVGGNLASLLYSTGYESPTVYIPGCAFAHLFNGQNDISSSKTYLKGASKLRLSTKTGTGCYAYMFYKCSNLTSGVKLPATTLSKGCYEGMYYGTGITSCTLPATTLVTDCYKNMFYFCNSLRSIKAMFTTTPSASYTENWVFGVASSGTFTKNASATWNVVGYNGVPTGWTIQTASA